MTIEKILNYVPLFNATTPKKYFRRVDENLDNINFQNKAGQEYIKYNDYSAIRECQELKTGSSVYYEGTVNRSG